MKKHLSVFSLIARSSIYKLLLLFLLLAAAESVLFCLRLQSTLSAAAALQLEPDGMEYVFTGGKVFWSSAVIFVLMTAQLCRVGCDFGSSQSYTLRRLRITEKSVFIWQTIFNILSFLMLWAVQLGVAMALCHAYVSVVQETSGQAIMLAFYRHKFLHSLLPLSDVSRYIRNIALVLALGIGAAKFSWNNRRGKLGVEIIALTALTVVFFAAETGSDNMDSIVIFLALAVGLEGSYSVLTKEDDDEED